MANYRLRIGFSSAHLLITDSGNYNLSGSAANLIYNTADSEATTNQRYVRQGATGTGSGLDWENAYTSFAGITYQRDTTYWVADGSYAAPPMIDVALDGTKVIRIKKASTSLHGTETGWSNTYGDGQAVFVAPFKIRKGYVTIDGSYRSESAASKLDWFTGSAYGFKIANGVGDYGNNIKIGGLTSGGANEPTTEGPANNVTIKYCYLNALPLTGAISGGTFQIATNSSSAATGIKIQRCLIDNGNNHLFIRDTNGALIEYCACTGAKSTEPSHGENINLYYSTPNAVIRYNFFKDNFDEGYSGTPFYGGTAVIALVGSDGCEVYGNVFWDNRCTDGLIGWNGDGGPTYVVTGLKFYNNTIVGGWGGAGVMMPAGSSSNEAYNNLWVNAYDDFANVTHNYNATSDTSLGGEANGQLNVPTSIFVDYANGDFRLATDTTGGVNLGSSYNVDINGNTRTTWSRGAFQKV